MSMFDRFSGIRTPRWPKAVPSQGRAPRFGIVALTVALVVVAGFAVQQLGNVSLVSGAFLGSSTINIDGAANFADWGTTGTPATGVAVLVDANNQGNNSVKNSLDMINFWVGTSTQDGGNTAASASNKIQNFYFRIDTAQTSAIINQNYNIQLNLGTAPAGKADHLLQIRGNTDGEANEVTMILFEYNTYPNVAAFTSGDITAKVSNESGNGVLDTNATGALGLWDATRRGFEIKIPVGWFSSTYSGSIKDDATGATSFATAVFTSTGTLGSVGTTKDVLNNSDGDITVASTSTVTGGTTTVTLQIKN